ncbi:MAG: WbuC family cupin fold metalloprotein [Desulfuromonadales bacterium]|nr:WbuC family cupin fold metalloprotein [Desulfuromonadales bacterium]
MKIVTRELLHQVTREALASPRRRKNHNIHPSDESRCHRLLNAIEPCSYIRPHRHQDPEKDEAFILMSGRLAVITFSPAGVVEEVVVLSHENGNLAADVPHGSFHTALSLQAGTVFYEAKAGPYLPLTDQEMAAWAPSENTPEALSYLEMLRGICNG